MQNVGKLLARLREAAMFLALLMLAEEAIAQSGSLTSARVQESQNSDTLKYAVEMRVEGGEQALLSAIKQTSVLVRHESKGAPDPASLISRGRKDKKQLVAALYEEARYGGTVEVSIAGRPIERADIAGLMAATGETIPIVIAVSPGPAFRFGELRIRATKTYQGGPEITPQDLGLVHGAMARSSVITSAISRLTLHWHAAGFPLAGIHEKKIVADHDRARVDVEVVIAPGRPAVYGWINVTGAQKLSHQTIAAQSALRPGQRFDPKDLEKARARLRKLDSIESVRIVEGSQVDRQGTIPITIAITERKPRYVGVTASVTTFDGAEVKATWGHRNIFGKGEHLRLEGSVSQIGAGSLDDLQFDASATLNRPGILDIDTDLFAQFRVARESNDVFLSDIVLAKVGLTRRFNEELTGSIAVEGRYAREDNEFSETDQVVFSLPADFALDTRNNRLDPTRGVRARVDGTPVTDVYNGSAFFVSEADIAGYWTLGPEDRATLAARLSAGSIVGSTLQEVPASYRFLAGGGNSVRGYEFQSIGTTVEGVVVGGLSFASASAELRLRPTEQVGIVPFIDAAVVSSDRLPDFSESVFVGLGLGLRYYTALGPIRLDAAIPLTNRDNRSAFGIYVGLGQSF